MHIHISVIAEALGESVRELIVRNENAAVIECVRILKNNAVPRESAKNDTCLYIVTVDSISIYNRDKENYKNLIAGVDIFDENSQRHWIFLMNITNGMRTCALRLQKMSRLMQ